ncbi:MAG TPA: PPOX class F420-dependent oxidoreductase [Thermomicrobiales bacterium]|jgi:PPOX class probable F420-dependent enzyme
MGQDVAARLTPEVRAFLEERRFAVVASIRADGLPHQTVMWYALRGDTILLNEGAARVRSKHLHRDPRLSLCVEDGDRYVTLSGPCELQSADQEAALADIVALASRYMGEEEGEKLRAFFAQEVRETIIMQIASVDARNFGG